jgi:hypothetical protein
VYQQTKEGISVLHGSPTACCTAVAELQKISWAGQANSEKKCNSKIYSSVGNYAINTQYP